MIDDGFKLFADRFNPILDVFAECGVKFALEVHPTEIAFDIYTAERALEALDHRAGVRLQLRPQPPASGRASIRSSSSGRSPTASITCTSRTRSSRSTAAPASWPATSTSATRAAAGTSAAPGRGGVNFEEIIRGPERASATTARSPSNGKTAAWTASTAPAKPASSSSKLDFAASGRAFDAAFAD